jgi:CRISPR/Cas system CSM-associated protein Csm3 (group 7 of RAMP superfamily)
MSEPIKLKGKIVIQGRIKTESPLHIGCGSDERSDSDILLGNDGKAFIPATAFIGVLKHSITQKDNAFKEQLQNFWGYTNRKEGKQSSVRCSDLICISETRTVIRDGIGIDNKTGMVKHQKKYDYEILERNSLFSVKIEFAFTHEDEALVKQMAASIFTLLESGCIQMGAKTNNGLGKIRLCKDATKIYLFDFSKKIDVLNWLTQKFLPANEIRLNSLGSPFSAATHRFWMDATLILKHSLIIKSYPNNPAMPDAVHIQSLDDPVLTGSSLKGAIRARAERIVKTLDKPDTIVRNLFGYVDKTPGAKEARKGKVRVHEIVMPQFVAELQNRIKIDRFTGGTIEGALFDSMPLFQDDSNKVIRVIVEVPKCKAAEAGLLLLVLKDLWTGDIAIGGEKNVGRGVFKGTSAFIEWNSERFTLDEDFSRIPPETRENLQQLVNAFTSEG